MDSQILIAQLQNLNLWPEDPTVQEEITCIQERLPEARALGKELLARNLLTPYQANQLLTGKGQTLAAGPYRIEERLGEGASARIFKAHHYRMHRVVALKIIRPERIQDNPNAVERFFREAQAAAALSHPNVVRAYDVGQDGEVYYFAMQFLDGVDLARLVQQEGRLDVNRACDYILQAARGLQHIHEHGMVHRDIKPSNLMVQLRTADWGLRIEEPAADITMNQSASPNPQSEIIKILDLGLARLDEDPNAPSQQAVLTRLGTVMGTPDYMAPEQALHSRHADIRSDIYSLGCSFYFALTGQPPFPGGDAIEKMLKHQLDQPTPVEDLRSDLPAAVRAILNKMMAKQKDARYQTPQELIDELQAFLEPPPRAIPLNSPPQVSVSTPNPAAVETIASNQTPLTPLISFPTVRVSSRGADWSLWLLLAVACIGAIICLAVAVFMVLR